jgi:hypothetical protein
MQPKMSVLKCVTVGVDYPNDCAVKGRQGYIWVREQRTDGGIFQVFNSEVKRIVGLCVLVATEYGKPFRKEVIGIDWDANPLTSEFVISNVPSVYNHALSHEWQETYPAADAISVYPRALVPLRIYPAISGGLKVDVVKGMYGVSGRFVYYAGLLDFDLTSYYPVSGYAGVLIYLNPATNAPAAVVGATVATAAAIVYPTFVDNMLPLAYVRLTAGATEIIESDIILDLRPVYTFMDKTLQNAIGALADEIDMQLSRHIVEGV